MNFVNKQVFVINFVNLEKKCWLRKTWRNLGLELQIIFMEIKIWAKQLKLAVDSEVGAKISKYKAI